MRSHRCYQARGSLCQPGKQGRTHCSTLRESGCTCLSDTGRRHSPTPRQKWGKSRRRRTARKSLDPGATRTIPAHTRRIPSPHVSSSSGPAHSQSTCPARTTRSTRPFSGTWRLEGATCHVSPEAQARRSRPKTARRKGRRRRTLSSHQKEHTCRACSSDTRSPAQAARSPLGTQCTPTPPQSAQSPASTGRIGPSHRPGRAPHIRCRHPSRQTGGGWMAWDNRRSHTQWASGRCARRGTAQRRGGCFRATLR